MSTINELKELLHYNRETGIFTWAKDRRHHKKGDIAGKDYMGYTRVNALSKPWLCHRLAWAFEHGEFPEKGFEIDHINRVGTDNRIINLRKVTHRENMINRDAVRYGGNITKKGNLFVAYIRVDGKQKHLGYNRTPEDARQAINQFTTNQ